MRAGLKMYTTTKTKIDKLMEENVKTINNHCREYMRKNWNKPIPFLPIRNPLSTEEDNAINNR